MILLYTRHNFILTPAILPAGVTSEASIQYKDEELFLSEVNDVDIIYINKVLPEKMKYNLKSIREFSLLSDIRTMFKTLITVFK